VLYTSEQAHSSVEKGAITAGIGRDNVRKIGVDAEFRMRVDLLADAVQQDLLEGRKPFCVVPTVGTTSTSSVDPVPAVAEIARRFSMWVHIDAAYAGPAAIADSQVLAGAERADSIVVNPHKWMFTPIDISAFYTRRPEVLRRAFSLVPEYLRSEEDPRAVNLMDYGVQLGRRFRALKLWFVMRQFGREGIADVIRNHMTWARELAAWIQEDPQFELCAPVPFSLVCFRLRGPDEPNKRLLEEINASGKAFLSHTVLNGQFVLRFAIGNVAVSREDIAGSWNLIRRCATRV
jgi:aromatic-L-amino-acid decarboxylase